MKTLTKLMILTTGLAILLAGCGSDSRVVSVTPVGGGSPVLATETPTPVIEVSDAAVVHCNGIAVIVHAKDVSAVTKACAESQEDNATVPPTQTPIVVTSIPPTATVTVASPTAVPPTVAPQAEQAKESDEYHGEGFTVDCSASCSGAKVQVYFPQSVPTYGIKEVHTIVAPGQKIQFAGGGGKFWLYPHGYNLDAMEAEMIGDAMRRQNVANFFGYVPLQQLVDAGLAIVK